MARKDFAESGGRQASRKPPMASSVQFRNMLAVVGILLVVAGSFVGGFWLGKGRNNAPRGISEADKNELLGQIKEQQQELVALKHQLKQKETAKKPAATDQVGDLTFYNSLPKQAVTPAPMSRSPTAPHRLFGKDGGDSGASMGATIQHELDASNHASADHAATPAGSFRVQVGSYQRKSDADGLMGQFHQGGFPCHVEETDVSGLGVWYRVYLGPYATRSEADATIKVVQQRMHITGLLLHGK